MIHKHFSAIVLGALMTWMFSGKIEQGIKNEQIKQLYASTLVAFENQDFVGAFHYSQKVLQKDSTHKKALLISSISAFNTGEHIKALDIVNILIKEDQNDYFLHYLKAKIINEGNLGSGCQEISEAIYLKRCILTSKHLPPDIYASTELIEASYKELLAFRMNTCKNEMPNATAMDNHLISQLHE